jgi:hypothetical protein
VFAGDEEAGYIEQDPPSPVWGVSIASVRPSADQQDKIRAELAADHARIGD